MAHKSNEPIEVEVDRVVAESSKAIAITREDEDDPIWIPRSLILDGSEVSGVGDAGTLVIPRWLAEEKRLID